MAKSKYQVWWSDDQGNRIQQLDQFAFLNYSRVVNGIGTCNIGLPYAKYGNIFRPDYRVEVYRTSVLGKKRRLEDVFFMQEAVIRTRQGDNVTILDMSGHNAMTMLDRRIEKYKAGTSQASKTDFIDDMMKEIVDENMGAAASADDDNRSRPYDAGAFRIQAEASDGASITKAFAYRNMLDILKQLHEISQTDGPRIYFDVVPVTNKIFEFQTFKDKRGGDRRFSAGKSAFYFSLERGNLEGPQYELDHFEERNVVYVGGEGEESDREVVTRRDTGLELASLWGRREMFRDDRNEPVTAGLEATGDEELGFNRTRQRFVANFLDAPGSRYGVDWDLGDLVTSNYAGIQFDTEIRIVYVSVPEGGDETIEGRNEFGEFG